MSIVSEDFGKLTTADVHGVARESYLPQIDALRAIAALGVLFFHFYTDIYLHAELEPVKIVSDIAAHGGFWRWIAAPSLLGYAGVPLFFVISGFCIHHSFLHARRPFSYLVFMSRRFWRIYPAYVLAIALSLLLPGNLIWRTHHVPKSVLMHLLFVHNLNQTTIFELSPPFWTLAVEFQFYAAYPLLLMLRRRFGMGRATLISFCLCVIASTVRHLGWTGHFDLPLLPVMYWVQWCLGALIAERFFDGKPPLINLPLSIFLWLVGICFAVPIATYSEWNYFAWAILSAAIIERLIRRNFTNAMSKPFASLVWVGTISYSIYLLHDIVLSQILPRLPSAPETRFGLGLIIAIPLVIAVSAVSYYLIEAPGIALGRKVIARVLEMSARDTDVQH
jgi:peptidoglycan/LPS O-acetylase OafA/YrhL